MPWCPKCGTEYRDGFAICADCGEQLALDKPATPVLSAENIGFGRPLAQIATVWLLSVGVTVMLFTRVLSPSCLLLIATLASFFIGYAGAYWFRPSVLPAAWLIALASVLSWNALTSAIVAPRSIGFALFMIVLLGWMGLVLRCGAKVRRGHNCARRFSSLRELLKNLHR